ncbi:hypothetical protein RSAG8_05562, partial [Rhizoctonia solani AG-8 WAC10335]
MRLGCSKYFLAGPRP